MIFVARAYMQIHPELIWLNLHHFSFPYRLLTDCVLSFLVTALPPTKELAANTSIFYDHSKVLMIHLV